MKRSHSKFMLLLLCAFALMLIGCWDYTEIENMDFVVGTGVDTLTPQLTLVSEVIVSSGLGEQAEFKPLVFSTEGKSVLGAARSLSNPAGLRLFYPHAEVFLVSEEVAREGVLPAIELIIRGKELRTSTFFFVTYGCTVEEVFNSKVPIVDSVSEHLASIANLHELIPVFYPQRMWEFRKDMVESGKSGVLPTVQLVHDGEELIPIVKGTVLFLGDKMVGWLDGDESFVFTLLRGDVNRGVFEVATTFEGETELFTYELLKNRLNIKPVVEGDKILIKIEITLNMDLADVGSICINFEDRSVLPEIEKQVSTAIKKRADDLIAKILKEYNTDVLGFGQLLKRKEPKIWDTVSHRWVQVLRTLDVQIKVDSVIVSTGVLSTALQTRD